MGWWGHFLTIFLFPAVGICAKFRGVSPCVWALWNNQYLCTELLENFGRMFVLFQVMHPSSLQHPYVHSTRFQTWSYAQTQQLSEQSFLKVTIFQIYVLFSAEILMPSSGFSSGSWHSHTIFIFVQFIFYPLLDTDISKRKRERSQRISRLLQDTVKSSGLRYSQYLRPSHQALPTRQTASVRTGSLPFLPWLHHLFLGFFEIYKSIFRKCYVCL